MTAVPVESFSALAARSEPPLDELALALAGEFRPVDADAALAELERGGDEALLSLATAMAPLVGSTR